MINFSKDVHVFRVVFIYGDDYDALFCIMREEPDGPRVLRYRFRYDGENGEPDRRNWYEVTEHPDAPMKLERAVEMIVAMAPSFEGTPETLDLDCDGEKAAGVLMERPWFNVVPTMPGAEA